VSDPASVEHLATAARDRFGPIHLLMNNAGVGYTGRAWRIKLDDWHWVMGVCFWGAVHGTQSFVPAMIEHGEEAHIVNTSSWHGFGAAPRGAPYQAAKQAVTALTESLYFDLRESAPQIGVSLLCPGYTNTRITESLRNHPDATVREKAAGVNRVQSTWAPPDSVADLVIDAVRERRFYILADAQTWLPIVRERFAAVVEQRDPVPLQLPTA
jgi:NAD(P)-dependent dehydrogenase (short-subunit alcohol dehydrogenase family)